MPYTWAIYSMMLSDSIKNVGKMPKFGCHNMLPLTIKLCPFLIFLFLALVGWDTSKVRDMSFLFSGAKVYDKWTSFDTQNVKVRYLGYSGK